MKAKAKDVTTAELNYRVRDLMVLLMKTLVYTENEGEFPEDAGKVYSDEQLDQI